MDTLYSMLPQTTGVDAVITFVEPFLVLLKKKMFPLSLFLCFFLFVHQVSLQSITGFFSHFEELMGPLPHPVTSQGSRSIKGPSHITHPYTASWPGEDRMVPLYPYFP